METDKSDYRTYFEYFRVPEGFDIPKKGKPASRDLIKYFRGEGFDEPYVKEALPSSKGGQVCCSIGDETGTAAYGVANCSYADNFCYKIGREIALGRAKKQLEKRRTNK